MGMWTDRTVSQLLYARAESVTENRNRYRDILKTETDTDVGTEKTENRRKKPKKNKNSVFADDDLLIWSIFIFCR